MKNTIIAIVALVCLPVLAERVQLLTSAQTNTWEVGSHAAFMTQDQAATSTVFNVWESGGTNWFNFETNTVIRRGYSYTNAWTLVVTEEFKRNGSSLGLWPIGTYLTNIPYPLSAYNGAEWRYDGTPSELSFILSEYPAFAGTVTNNNQTEIQIVHSLGNYSGEASLRYGQSIIGTNSTTYILDTNPVDRSITNGLVNASVTNGLVTATVTNGLASTNAPVLQDPTLRGRVNGHTYVPVLVGTAAQLPELANRTNGILYVEIP